MYDLVFDMIAISTVWYAVVKYRNNKALHIMGSWLFAYYTFKHLI
jgi:hypothetical protein